MRPRRAGLEHIGPMTSEAKSGEDDWQSNGSDDRVANAGQRHHSGQGLQEQRRR